MVNPTSRKGEKLDTKSCCTYSENLGWSGTWWFIDWAIILTTEIIDGRNDHITWWHDLPPNPPKTGPSANDISYWWILFWKCSIVQKYHPPKNIFLLSTEKRYLAPQWKYRVSMNTFKNQGKNEPGVALASVLQNIDHLSDLQKSIVT